MSATFRMASEFAQFGQPEVKLGVIPGYGGTQRLPRVIGETRALDMILTGRTVDAEEALQIGLLNAVADGPLLDEGLAFLRRITRFSLPSLKLARDAVRRGMETNLNEGLKIEADLSTLAYRTADAEEGMAAFEEKRKPRFRDG